MRSSISKLLVNLFFFFILFYLIYHSLYGNYTVQSYLIDRFETKMYEDFNYKIKHDLIMVNKDIYALKYNFQDMNDEISKRKNPYPEKGEYLIKLD